MKTHDLFLVAAVVAALALFAGCMGEGEQDFRPTPGIINVSY